MTKFGIGQSTTRVEDPRLLTGGGRYTDDTKLEEKAARAYVLRSPHAHAAIRSIDTAAAKKAPAETAPAKAARPAAKPAAAPAPKAGGAKGEAAGTPWVGEVPPTDPARPAIERGGRYMGFSERFNRYYTDPSWQPSQVLYAGPKALGDGASP